MSTKNTNNWRKVKASSFADPADKRAFDACKRRGGTDQQCFAVGDNCVGCWGDATDAARPMCALPLEDWAAFGKAARGRLVEVRIGGKVVVCELRDTMPRKRYITNGAGIDLNPAAVAAFGLKPPIMVAAEWRWHS